MTSPPGLVQSGIAPKTSPVRLVTIGKAIERYVVYPGQATASMNGQRKIMDLGGTASAGSGTKFDSKNFMTRY